MVWWVLGIGVCRRVATQDPPVAVRLARVREPGRLAAWTALGAIWSDSVARTLHEASRTLGLRRHLPPRRVGLQPGMARGRGRADPDGDPGLLLGVDEPPWARLLPTGLEQSGYFTKRLSFRSNYWNAVGAWARDDGWPGALLERACAASVDPCPGARRSVRRGSGRVSDLLAGLRAAGVVIAVVAVIALSRHRWLVAVNAFLAATSSLRRSPRSGPMPRLRRAPGRSGPGRSRRMLAPMAIACLIGACVSAFGKLERIRLAPRVVRVLQIGAVVAVVVAAVAVGPALANDAWDSFQRRGASSVPADPAQRFTNLSGERASCGACARRIHEAPAAWRGRGHVRVPLESRRALVPPCGGRPLAVHRDARRDSASRPAPAARAAGHVTARRADRAVSPARRGIAGAATGCAAALVVFCVDLQRRLAWESTAVAVAAFAAPALPWPPRRVRADVAAAPSPPTSGRSFPSRSQTVPRIAVGRPRGDRARPAGSSAVADAEVASSQKAFASGEPADAVADASSAAHAEPWSATPLLQRAGPRAAGFLEAARWMRGRLRARSHQLGDLADPRPHRGGARHVSPRSADGSARASPQPVHPLFQARAGG